MIERLKKSQNVYFVGLCEGRANLILRFLVKRVDEFDELLDELMGRFGRFIHDKEVTVVTADPLGFTIAGAHVWEGKENVPLKKKKMHEDVKIDKKDLEMLRILFDDSRTPIVDIAREVDLSADAVSYRIKRLVRSGVILGFRLSLDSSKIGFEHRKIFLRLNYTSRQRKHDFFKYYSIHPNVVFLLGCIGNWDAELDFDVKDTRHFHELATDLKNNFGNQIRDYDTCVFLEEHYPNVFENLQEIQQEEHPS
jgi:Lrp/AsnC family transcriptional regulator for asnA, asnC and gidA